MAGDQILDLLKIIQTEGFATGSGQLVTDFDMITHMVQDPGAMVSFPRKLKAVLDAGNGLSGTYVYPLLKNSVWM